MVESRNSLDEYRATLDAIDYELLDTLRRRIEICCEIAKFKRDHGVPMMQPARIGIVLERAEKFGIENDISQEFLKSLFDLIIEETCRLEDSIIQG